MTVERQSPTEPIRVLLVSYLFPPAGGVGVQRALALARYLPHAGCRVSVLTARNPVTHVYDTSLEQKIPTEVKIHRTAALEPPYALRQGFKRIVGLRHPVADPNHAAKPASASPAGIGVLKRAAKGLMERMLFPDPQRLWVGPSIAEASRIIEQERIESVVLTVPPFSLLHLAPQLRRRFPELTIVLDFRDEWLEYHLEELDGTASAWKKSRSAELERTAVAAADTVVTVTPPWVERLRRRYRNEADEKFVYVPNGYDPASFIGFRPQPPPAPPLVVSYLGTLDANPVYSAQPYLDALQAMGEEWSQRIETRFIGRVAPSAAPLLVRSKARLVQLGFMPQQQAFAQLRESHCLLLLIGTAGVHSGKLFEYLATGISVLAITPPGGEVARVIEETGAGWCAAPGDPASIGAALRRIYDLARGCTPEAGDPQRKPEAIGAYDRAQQAKVFAGLLARGVARKGQILL